MHRASETDIAEFWALGVADQSVGRSDRLGAWILATWVGVGTVVLLPAALIYITPAPNSSVWLLALVITTISGFRYTWIVADGRRRLFEVSFWVFTYVFLGIAPLVQLRTGQTPYTTPRIDITLQLEAMVIIIIGIVSFAVGLSAVGTRRRLLPETYEVNGVNRGRTVVLAVFALLVDLYFISKVGPATLFSSRDSLARAIEAAWPVSFIAVFISAIAGMSTLVAFIALVKFIWQTGTREWPLIGLTVIVGLALAVTINPISNARYVFGTAALAVAALFGLFATPRRFRLTAIMWLIVLILVFPLMDAFRYSTDGELKSRTLTESLSSPDFDAYAQINNTLLYVEREGLTQGRQAAGVLLFWVPRSLWPDKPRDTGILIAETRGYEFKNLSAPIWAELYINGGWALLVIGMLGLGVLVRSQDKRIEDSLQRARAPSILACILPFYLMIVLRGSLLQAMSYLFAILSCAVFVSRWKKASSR